MRAIPRGEKKGTREGSIIIACFFMILMIIANPAILLEKVLNDQGAPSSALKNSCDDVAK
jgi:hypothetical protein